MLMTIIMGTFNLHRIRLTSVLLVWAAVTPLLPTSFTPTLQADAYDDALNESLTGEYSDSLEVCEEQLKDQQGFNEKWYLLGIKNCMHLGRYKRAFEILQEGLEDRRVSGIKLYPVGHEVALFNNRPDLAPNHGVCRDTDNGKAYDCTDYRVGSRNWPAIVRSDQQPDPGRQQ